MTIELWNFLKVIHEFSGMAAVGALLATLIITVKARGRAGADASAILRAVSRWLIGPALALLLASGLGLGLTNSYRLSPTFVVLGLAALLAAVFVWAFVMLPAETAALNGSARRWLTGWSTVAVLLLFGAAIMIVRPVWWSGVSAATSG